MPESWKTAFASGEVKGAEAMEPFAVSSDGGQLFARISGVGGVVIAAVTPALNKQTTIASYKQGIHGVLGGDFDGRWLVWSENQSQQSFNDWELFAYDTEMVQLIKVAEVARIRGEPIAGPIIFPVVDHAKLAWTQSTPLGETELHVYDLLKRTDTVVSRNHPGAPISSWPWLVWAEPSGAPGTAETLRAISFETSRPVDLPRPLVAASSASFLGGAPGIIAWTDKGLRSIWVWKQGMDAARLLYTAPEGDYAEFVSVGSEIVTWNGVDSAYAGDLRTLSVTRIVAVPSSPKVRGHGLVFSFSADQAKAASRPERVFLIPTKDLRQQPQC